MNILITAPSLDPTKNVSGIGTIVNTIMKNNGKQRYFHYLLGRPDDPSNKLSWLIQVIKQLCAFPFFVKRNRIDIVHQNLPFDPKGLAREYIINSWCRLLKVPAVLHIHGGVFLMKKTTNPLFFKISKSLFKHSKQVIVLSEIETQSLAENYGFKNAFVLPNSIDIAEYETKEKKINLQYPTFLFLGRIHESKGIEEIISALKKLKKHQLFKFIACGNGPLKDQLVANCEMILGENFEYAGIVSGTQKIDIIKKADFFLLPSRYGEGLPMALLETMANGVIPIVTNDASMKYIIKSGINGICVNKNDPEDLYEKMCTVVSDESLSNLLSIKATETIAEKYNIDDYIKKLNAIYNLSQ